MLNSIIITIFIATLVVGFHILIFIKIIPYQIAWGGRLKNDREMYIFQTISIMVNLLFIWILMMKGGYFRNIISLQVMDMILWVFFGLFVLNTFGNIFAKTLFEKYFLFITLLLSFLVFSILVS
jgi:hypothetical protein